MDRHHTLAWIACSLLSVAFAGSASAQQHAMPKASSDQDIIRSAMAAAPPAIARNATIIAVSQDGKIRTVRKGTNTFTCMADNLSTPGPDPMCGDQNAMAWAQAWIEHKDPPAGKVGFMYMLEGGTDASNTDPYAQQPEPNNNWVKTGPHVMVVGAKGMMDGYPREARPDTTQPYVMWANTPYEHLMLPVQSPRTAAKSASR
jgi:hypothetical protein